MKHALIFLSLLLFFGLLGLFARWWVFRKRDAIPLQELYAASSLCGRIPYVCFEKVMLLVGKCYHVNPEKLRLDDTFSGPLSDYDSWMLGGGAEDLDELLRKQGLILNDTNPLTITTISDLIERMAKAQGAYQEQNDPKMKD